MEIDREAIDKLPVLARVAFAARCARRMQGLIDVDTLSSDELTSIKAAVEDSERFSCDPSAYPATVTINEKKGWKGSLELTCFEELLAAQISVFLAL